MPLVDRDEKKKYQHEYYLKHKAKIVERSRAYESTPKGKQTKRVYHLRKKYNIDETWYATKLVEQNGKCAICGRDGNRRKFAIDHNHLTGELRGLLCFRCNTDLGVLEDSDFVTKANKYVIAYQERVNRR